MRRPKVLATIGLGRYEQLLNITRPTFEQYAACHGYDLRVLETDPAPERKHKQWAKVAFINQILSTCDLLLWIDCDAAIVDMSVDIASTLPPRCFLGLVEHHYDDQSIPNTGVMIIRSGRRSRRFFAQMWDYTQYLETRWHDNAAALEMLGYEFDPDAEPMYCHPAKSTEWLARTRFLGNEWNSLPQDSAASPQIVHVTGAYPFEQRLERLRTAVDRTKAGEPGVAPGPAR